MTAPYYQDKWVTIYHGDCREIVPQLDTTVDLVLTDPPYKMNHSTGGCTNIGMKNRWLGNIKAGNTIMDFDTDLGFNDWLSIVFHTLSDSHQGYIFTNDKNLHELIGCCQDVGFLLTNILVWKKNNATPNRYYMKNCEFILFLRKGLAVPIKDMSTKAVLEFNNINGQDKLHPVEKPVGLLKVLIANSTNETELVLDPFLGSGSTLLACKCLNRRCVGIEVEERYCEIAARRCTQEVMELICT